MWLNQLQYFAKKSQKCFFCYAKTFLPDMFLAQPHIKLCKKKKNKPSRKSGAETEWGFSSV